MILSTLAFEITPLSNTSKPSRRGTRTSATLMNSGTDWGPRITSVINNLAALLPISIAANLTWDQCFFIQVIVGIELGPHFFTRTSYILVAQVIIQPARFYIIMELYVQYINKFLF